MRPPRRESNAPFVMVQLKPAYGEESPSICAYPGLPLGQIPVDGNTSSCGAVSVPIGTVTELDALHPYISVSVTVNTTLVVPVGWKLSELRGRS